MGLQASSERRRGDFAPTGCMVAAGTRLMTPAGAPRVEDLADAAGPVSVWTTAGWAPAEVRLAGELPVCRVHLSDGSALECAADACWPIVSDEPPPAEEGRPRSRSRWEPRPASGLGPGDRVITYPAIVSQDLVSAPELDENTARTKGAHLGQKAANLNASRPGLSDDVCGDAAKPGLSPEAIRAFVEGWSESQQGCLVGCPYVMADLQVILRRAGVRRTLLEKGPHRTILVVDDRDVWAAAGDGARSWTRRLCGTRQIVVEVESLNQRRKVYAVTVQPPGESLSGDETADPVDAADTDDIGLVPVIVAVAVNNTMMSTGAVAYRPFEPTSLSDPDSQESPSRKTPRTSQSSPRRKSSPRSPRSSQSSQPRESRESRGSRSKSSPRAHPSPPLDPDEPADAALRPSRSLSSQEPKSADSPPKSHSPPKSSDSPPKTHSPPKSPSHSPPKTHSPPKSPSRSPPKTHSPPRSSDSPPKSHSPKPKSKARSPRSPSKPAEPAELVAPPADSAPLAE